MKKIIAGILAITLVGGLIGGGVYWKQKNGGKPVAVYGMDNLTTSYWGDENESYGAVNTDQTQSVYLSSTQIVQEVLVQEGQKVQKGDVLMTYDTTLSAVELEKKHLEIQKLELELSTAKDNLNKVKTYRPGKKISKKNQIDTSSLGMTILGWAPLFQMLLTEENPAQSGEGETEPAAPAETTPAETTAAETTPEETVPTETETPAAPESTQAAPESTSAASSTSAAPESTPAETTPEETETTEEEDHTVYPSLIGGMGTKNSPYVYNWNGVWDFNEKLYKKLAQDRKNAYVVLQMTLAEGSDPTKRRIQLSGGSTEIVYPSGTWILMEINGNNSGFSGEIISMSIDGVVVELQPSGSGEEETEPDSPSYGGGGYSISYTAAEIAELLADTSEKVRDLDLELRMAQAEYAKMERELNNGAVVSEIDGVIAKVGDPETALADKQSLIDVSGGGGYYIRGTVSELKLDTIYVGMPITVTSFETYMEYEGLVSEISDYPASGNNYDYSGNSNASYYYYTVFVDESADLKEYEYVSMKYQSNTGSTDAIYLANYMMRTENGKSFVYVQGEDGKLEKRDVTTGKSLWGSYTEIRSGLNGDELIAFPYGKNVKEGADTVEESIDTLYGAY